MEEIFTGKSVEEAVQAGLTALGLDESEAEIVVLEEGKKKIFGSVKAKVQIKKKVSDAKRAVEFIDGLLEILKISAVSEIVEEDDNIKIDIKATNSSKVIGKRGDVLDAIQCIAGAVANIGRDRYRKVVVDCENYRSQREETLKALAEKLAKKAVEKGRKMTLEPMNPYERRIIHSALADNPDVKTVSEGKEPLRYIAVIPNNAKPYDKGLRYGEYNGGERRGQRGGDRKFGKPFNKDRNSERRFDKKPSNGGSGSGAKRGKKEIHFGTFLGNSGAGKTDDKD